MVQSVPAISCRDRQLDQGLEFLSFQMGQKRSGHVISNRMGQKRSEHGISNRMGGGYC